MRYSKVGLELTERFEGCHLAAYQDQAGVWTIGYGHTAFVKPGGTCTQAQAEAWLDKDICWAECTVHGLVHVDLTQNEFDALVDFVFNLGAHPFSSSTMLRLLNQGKFSEAAQEFDKWDHAGGKVVAGLLRRRQAEKNLFLQQE